MGAVSARRTRKEPHGQDGLAIVLVLFFIIIATVVGGVTYNKIHNEGRGTQRNANLVKAQHLADAGVFLGMAIARGDFPYSCVTHAPNGSDRATGPEACTILGLAGVKSVYSTQVRLNTYTGWVEVAPANTAESLSGVPGEKIAIKIWNPSPDTVRVVGRSSVNGVSQDAQLFGSWGGL